MALITPVVMSGGVGSRLWPVSRVAKPKQLHRLGGEKTLLEESLARFSTERDGLFGPGVLVCNAAYSDAAAKIARSVAPSTKLLVEPFGRNTAACAATVSYWLAERQPEALILLSPADHHMADPGAFLKAVAAAASTAASGRLVVFGVRPDSPETGFGYIKIGEHAGSVLDVERFVEKPDQVTAQAYLDSGQYLWNAGYFLYRADHMIKAFERLQPEIARCSRQAVAEGERVGDTLFLDEAAFQDCPSDSLDYAIVEKADNVAVVPFDGGWSDLGAWDAIWARSSKDQRRNAASGDTLLLETSGCLISTDGPMVAAYGVENLIIIVHEGVVLVAPRENSQAVKQAVESLKAANRTDVL